MLIEFSVENYKCFATKQTLNLRPDPEIHALDENLIRTGLTQENGEELVLLPTVAIYGANASGKSNLLEILFPTCSIDRKMPPLAIKFFANTEDGFSESNQVFLLAEPGGPDGEEPEKFFIDTCSYTAKPYLNTRLHSIEGGGLLGEAVYCIHNGEVISGFNSPLYNSNGPTYMRTYYFLNDILNQSEANAEGVFESKHDEPIPLMATLDDPERKEKLKQLLRKADFNIEDITVHKAQSGKNKTLYTLEFKIKGQEETLWYNDQSDGTKRFLLMMPIIVHVLETGAILLADELEQHLHPDLCKAIVELFNSRETNPHGSQLIFTTHNLDFMDLNLMRPDQLYFINKDEETGASELYRASDYDMDWNDDDKWSDPAITIQRLYDMGSFSAKPSLWGGLS